MKICLFGGTFDPIHLGHTYIAQQVVRQLGVDKVIFLPCQQSPHKIGHQSATAEDRFNMCQLATSAFPWAEVNRFDLDSPPPSYSWRTAEHFRALYPAAQLYWLMGTDQWESITRWDRSRYFASMLHIVVYNRGAAIVPFNGYDAIELNTTQHPASATAIRKNLANSLTTPWMPPQVARYAQEKKLYTKSPLD